jgi:hypothetical protein
MVLPQPTLQQLQQQMKGMKLPPQFMGGKMPPSFVAAAATPAKDPKATRFSLPLEDEFDDDFDSEDFYDDDDFYGDPR